MPADTPENKIELRIEPMKRSDLGDVMGTEMRSFPKPWTLAMFENELENPVSFSFVARAEGSLPSPRVIAYAVFWIVRGEAHILNLAVHPEWRRRGIALMFLKSIIDTMRRKEVFEVVLEVRKSNAAAVSLYKGLGFSEAYTRKRYYGDEDAIVMTLEL